MFSRLIHLVACISTSFLFTFHLIFNFIYIPLHGYAVLCLSIHQLMNICVVSTFWLLWIIMPSTSVWKFLCAHILSFFLGYISRNGIAESYGNCMFEHLKNWQTALESTLLYCPPLPPPIVYKSSEFSTSLPILIAVHIFFFIITSRCGVVSYWDIDLHFLVDLMILIIFSCVHWPFVYLLEQNVYSNLFPIFKLSCLFLIEL